MKSFINLLKQAQLLREINEPVQTELEIAHIAYIEAKKPEPQALLFTRVFRGERELGTSVLANLFASEKVLNLVLGASPDRIAARIEELLKMHIPATFGGKIDLAQRLFALKNIPPRRKINPNAPCKEREYELSELPVLKTWEHDAAAFITMGQVYTRSLDGSQNNLGMYRLQLAKTAAGEDALLAHFQLHKDANSFFYEYKKAGKKMPVAVAIGAHPLHILCAQAPLPKGIFELLLAGFITGKGAELVRCDEIDLYVPAGADFVLECEIDPAEPLALEGPFGDHTGFYTPQGLFPAAKILKITGQKEAIFNATVVGKPPLEDRWMGYATERIFAPLLRTSVPAVIDYHLPEAGAFHNLCVVKIRADYPGAAMGVAHAFWGLGQMAFCKNIVVVSEDAPALKDYAALAEHVLERLDASRLLQTTGLCDELDHSAAAVGLGGKLLIDATGCAGYFAATNRQQTGMQIACEAEAASAVDGVAAAKSAEKGAPGQNPVFCEKKGAPSENPFFSQGAKAFKAPDFAGILAALDASSMEVFYKDAPCAITCVFLRSKPGNIDFCAQKLAGAAGGVVVLFDDAQSKRPYMLLWRALANFDAARDLRILPGAVLIDACSKGAQDGYDAPWPRETSCTKEVIKSLVERKILEFDENLFKSYEILTDKQINEIKESLDGDF